MERNDQHESSVNAGAVMENRDRAPVTVIGLGPMGQALAGAFLKKGHPTTVWNRSARKAEDVVARGAILANTVAEAITASPVVIICVLDYNVVDTILKPAGENLRGRMLVNLTTGSPSQSRHMADWAVEHGIEYIDGVIMTPTTTIGTAASVILYSGPEIVYSSVQPTLASLDGTVAYLGDDPGRAAAHDVALLDLFWSSMGGYLHALAVAGAENIAAKDFAAYAQAMIATLPELMTEIADHVDKGQYPGDMSNIFSAVSSMEHIINTAERHGIDVSLLNTIKAVAQRAIDKGYGTEAVSRITELLRNPTA
ncbi:NAD(P)-dependent oxidoreductase [Paenibacillus alkalitolerans]|uniref:NAD(P)-dependent oxidoreductase n=1 Tax=Paenibacillus alkalitolerans TaxID=2799335 RepID=UPI002D7F94AB|nr:NAD(P)-binding domain-containing protein [Paenibacillus alkalitolerans]